MNKFDMLKWKKIDVDSLNAHVTLYQRKSSAASISNALCRDSVLYSGVDSMVLVVIGFHHFFFLSSCVWIFRRLFSSSARYTSAPRNESKQSKAKVKLSTCIANSSFFFFFRMFWWWLSTANRSEIMFYLFLCVRSYDHFCSILIESKPLVFLRSLLNVFILTKEICNYVTWSTIKQNELKNMICTYGR